MQNIVENKITPTAKSLVETIEYEVLPVLKGAFTIYFTKFFSFVITSVSLVVSFLLAAFGLLYGYGNIDSSSFNDILTALQNQDFLRLENKQSLLIFPLAWIFFSWLRMSYLVAANGYFEKSNPIISGLSKLVSFMMVELMRIIVLILSLILFPIMPFIITKYFVSPAVLAAQNEGGINSMFESAEYVEGRMTATIFCAFFINVFILSLMLGCFIVTDFFIKDDLIFWSLNILLFIFFFLPIHACYRFMIFKKLQFLDGELRVQESNFQKFWFVVSRLFVLGLVVTTIILVASGKFDNVVSDYIFKLLVG